MLLFAGVNGVSASEHDYIIEINWSATVTEPVPEQTCTPETCHDIIPYPPNEPEYPPTIEPTETSTPEPTAEPTVVPTEPIWEPTVEPTAEPTIEPTPEPTTEPTTEPTAIPTASPTPAPFIPNGANFTCYPTTVHINEPIHCVDTTPNPTYAWQWSWSDGSNRSYTKEANHTYTKPGYYSIWHSAHSNAPYATGALWKMKYIAVHPTPLMAINATKYLGQSNESSQILAIVQRPKYLAILAEDNSIIGVVEFVPDRDGYEMVVEYNETEVEIEV
jgi:hypothetical protein